MPDSLRLVDGGYMRRPDVNHIIQHLYNLRCVEVIGMSNIGKSALLRLLAQPDVWTQELGEAGNEFLPVYIDCNRMLEMSDHGFYELILRCLQESSPQMANSSELAGAYETLVTPASEFQVPLSFSRGLTTILQSTRRKLVLLFDEFDEPFSQIDSRVLLNLRALKDRYQGTLAFVTAVGRPLVMQRSDDHCGEFCELFSHQSWYLAPLTRSDVDRFVRRYVTVNEVEFIGADVDFIYEWGGGHPRLLDAICRLLAAALSSTKNDLGDPLERWQLHRTVARQLRSDDIVQMECEKIWQRCTEEEQAEMQGLFTADYANNPAIIEQLIRMHLLLKATGKPVFFCQSMTEFVQRHAIQTDDAASAIWVDVDSGEVLVDGSAVDTLTNLEYRLMLLLFQNADKIIDKFQIVSRVWGDEYIDEVDDARIEKLVSRLRQKIEQDPSTPQFLTTVRGRGYRLVTEQSNGE